MNNDIINGDINSWVKIRGEIKGELALFLLTKGSHKITTINSIVKTLKSVEKASDVIEHIGDISRGTSKLNETKELVTHVKNASKVVDTTKEIVEEVPTLSKISNGVVEGTEKAIKGGSDALQALPRQSVDDKLTRYLLNADHPVGGSKAKWFKEALGYTQNNMDDLAKQITFDPTKAVQTGVTEYGTKFNQSISITGANGKVIDVTFAWMKSATDDVVRLVTSIPTKK